MKVFLVFLFRCLWFLLPAALSNHNASVGNRLLVPKFIKPWLAKLDVPVDFGYKLKGKDLFGRNKTFRGFVVGIVTGVLLAALQSILFLTVPFFKENSLIDYGRVNFVIVGFLMGFGALFGDLVESFIKRQLGKRAGEPWFPFDQLDWIAASIILTGIVYVPPLNYLIGIILVYLVVHLISDRIVQKMGLKKREDVFK